MNPIDLCDPCGRCGCRREHHNPPAGEVRGKSNYSNGGFQYTEILARTCCSSCPYCICFCVAWLEPYHGQPYAKCGFRDFSAVPPCDVHVAPYPPAEAPTTKTVAAWPRKKRAKRVNLI